MLGCLWRDAGQGPRSQWGWERESRPYQCYTVTVHCQGHGRLMENEQAATVGQSTCTGRALASQKIWCVEEHRRETWKEEALDDLCWKDERGPSSFRQTLQLFQRQCWGNFWEMEWSADGLFRTHRYHLELNWTTLVSPQNLIPFVGCFCFRLTWLWNNGEAGCLTASGLPAMESRGLCCQQWSLRILCHAGHLHLQGMIHEWLSITVLSAPKTETTGWLLLSKCHVLLLLFLLGEGVKIYMFQLDSCSSILPDKQACYQDVKVHSWYRTWNHPSAAVRTSRHLH